MRTQIRFLLAISLSSVAFFPQAGIALPMNEECVSRNGIWERGPDGVEGCFTRQTKEDCSDRRGMWAQVDRSPLGRCQLNLRQEQRIDECRANGGLWGRYGPGRAYCYDPRLAEACLAKGGTWGPDGMAGIPRCAIPAADAGKACKDGSECQLKSCLYNGPDLRPGQSATGTCKRTDSPFGCFVQIQNGRYVGGGVCVD